MNPRYLPTYKLVTVTAPAAGAEFTLTPNTAAWWVVKSLRFQLVTDANVASRGVSIGVTDGNSQYLRLRAVATQTATQTLVYCGYPGASAGSFGGSVSAVDWPTDGVWVPQGGSLSSITALLQAGDQFSGITAAVFECPVGPEYFMQPFDPSILRES